MKTLVGIITMATWVVLGYYGIFTETPVLKTIIFGGIAMAALLAVTVAVTKHNKGKSPEFVPEFISICIHSAVINSVIF